MKRPVEHIAGRTFHGRRGSVTNAFHYGVDYVLLDAERDIAAPALFRRNAAGLVSLHDADHGGAPGAGRGAAWVRDVLAREGLDGFGIGRIELLAQPRILGHVFNPVSFWLIRDRDEALRVVIPEVTNTYGHRHSYLCHADDLAPIDEAMTLAARKMLHVSPFQPLSGRYNFRFDVDGARIAIRIEYETEGGGLIATLAGRRRPLTAAGLLGAMLRRPLGSRRVLGLIHWQALKLWWKGATFRPAPAPPHGDVSR